VADRLTLPTPSPVAARRSYLDLLRVVAIAAVVTGHWLLMEISYRDGRLAGQDALAAIPSAAPLTWLFQVMPVFFLVGGYVNAGSWLAWRDDGGGWATWVATRARRLLRPASVYLAAVVVAVVLVWGSIHQWGFVWRDRASGSPPATAALLAGGGAGLFAVLVLCGAFPADLIGARNTGPPSIALLAFGAAQTGLVVLAEPAVTRVLDQRNRGRRVQRVNASAITVYLWHMIPVVVIAVVVYPRVPLPQPVIGSVSWWALRPVWVVGLAALLVPMTLAVDRFQAPLLPARLPPTPSAPARSLLVTLGISTVGWALARLAIAGAAPQGRLAVPVVVTYAAGVLFVEAAAGLRALEIIRRVAPPGEW
jgi:hypothetical protein